MLEPGILIRLTASTRPGDKRLWSLITFQRDGSQALRKMFLDYKAYRKLFFFFLRFTSQRSRERIYNFKFSEVNAPRKGRRDKTEGRENFPQRDRGSWMSCGVYSLSCCCEPWLLSNASVQSCFVPCQPVSPRSSRRACQWYYRFGYKLPKQVSSHGTYRYHLYTQ